MSDQYILLKEFVLSLHKLCKQKKSKIIFFTSNLNRAGRIVIDDGHIVSIRFFNKSGRQALDAVLEIEKLKFRVDDTASGIMSDLDTPTNQEIFSRLLAANEGVQPISTEAPAEAQLTEAIKSDIEEKLINIIGPMGGLLCKDILQTATDIHQVMSELSKQLSIEDMEMFKNSLDVT